MSNEIKCFATRNRSASNGVCVSPVLEKSGEVEELGDELSHVLHGRRRGRVPGGRIPRFGDAAKQAIRLIEMAALEL
jgi:hypothetical protein